MSSDRRHTIQVEARILSWRTIRNQARISHCRCRERQVGVITREFTITGTEGRLGDFIRELAKDDGALGRSVRRAIQENNDA